MLAPWLAAASFVAAIVAAAAALSARSRHRAGMRERESFLSLSWDLLGFISRDGRLHGLNPMWEKSLGLTSEALKSRPLLEFIHPADRVAMETELLRLAAAPGEALFQNRFECPDGTHKWISWKVRSNPGRERIDVVARDLGARAQPGVEETRNFLDSVVENIPAMVFVKDARDLNFVMFNRAGEELLGHPREDFIGRNDYDFFPKEQADFFTAKDREVLAGEAVLDIPDEPIQTRSGPRRLHTKKIAVRDSKGKPAYLLGISEDITEIKQAEQLQNDIVAMATHELRTPLTSIVWGLDMLVQGDTGALPDQARETAKLALGNAQLLVRLVNNYLTVVNIELGRSSFVMRPVSLPHFLEEALRAGQLFADRCGVKYVLRLDAPGALVSADSDRLMQVVSNLLSNAVKFSPAGGAVEVALERRPGGKVRVSVTDRGPGLPADIKANVFQKFTQSRTSDPKRKGTGLGLSIAKAIVEKLGGRIGFESDPKSGTTFYFELTELSPVPPPSKP